MQNPNMPGPDRSLFKKLWDFSVQAVDDLVSSGTHPQAAVSQVMKIILEKRVMDIPRDLYAAWWKELIARAYSVAQNNGSPQTPGVKTSHGVPVAAKGKNKKAKIISPPSLILGRDVETVEKVVVPGKIRAQGIYLLGDNGTGKSTIEVGSTLRDAQAGIGLALIDPHGLAIKAFVRLCPKDRLQDIILVEPGIIIPGRESWHIGVNLFARTSLSSIDTINHVAMDVFDNLWGFASSEPSWGIRMQQLWHACNIVLLYNNSTLSELPYLLKDRSVRDRMLQSVPRSGASHWVHFKFEKEYNDIGKQEQERVAGPVLNKALELLSTEAAYWMLIQSETTIPMRYILDNRKILLVHLDATRIGTEGMRYISTVLLSQLIMAAKSRDPDRKNQYFAVYCDELQHFASTSLLKDAFAECRKFGVGFCVAHQYRDQISTDLQGACGQMGTQVTFRVQKKDAQAQAINYAKEPPVETKIEENRTPTSRPINYIVNGHSHESEVVNTFAKRFQDTARDAGAAIRVNSSSSSGSRYTTGRGGRTHSVSSFQSSHVSSNKQIVEPARTMLDQTNEHLYLCMQEPSNRHVLPKQIFLLMVEHFGVVSYLGENDISETQYNALWLSECEEKLRAAWLAVYQYWQAYMNNHKQTRQEEFREIRAALNKLRLIGDERLRFEDTWEVRLNYLIDNPELMHKIKWFMAYSGLKVTFKCLWEFYGGQYSPDFEDSEENKTALTAWVEQGGNPSFVELFAPASILFEFVREVWTVCDCLSKEPILERNGTYQTVEVQSHRSQSDMEKEMEKELVRLPNHTAYVKIGTDKESESVKIETITLPDGVSDNELEARIKKIREQTRQYETVETDIERELQTRRVRFGIAPSPAPQPQTPATGTPLDAQAKKQSPTTSPPAPTPTPNKQAPPAPAAPTTPLRVARRRVQHPAPGAPAPALTFNDDYLLLLYHFHFLTLKQVCRLLGKTKLTDETHVREKLNILVKNKMIAKKPIPQDKKSPGRVPDVFFLAPDGMDYVKNNWGLIPGKRTGDCTTHTLLCTDALITLALLPTVEPAITLTSLLHERYFKERGIPLGNNQALEPDGLLQYTLSPPWGVNGEVLGIALEVDRGFQQREYWQNEKLRKHLAFAGGIYQDRFHSESLTIAVYCAGGNMPSLLKWTEELTKDRADLAGLFLFTDADPAITDPLAWCTSPLWSQPFSTKPVSLIEKQSP